MIDDEVVLIDDFGGNLGCNDDVMKVMNGFPLDARIHARIKVFSNFS